MLRPNLHKARHEQRGHPDFQIPTHLQLQNRRNDIAGQNSIGRDVPSNNDIVELSMRRTSVVSEFPGPWHAALECDGEDRKHRPNPNDEFQYQAQLLSRQSVGDALYHQHHGTLGKRLNNDAENLGSVFVLEMYQKCES